MVVMAASAPSTVPSAEANPGAVAANWATGTVPARIP
jgi:hypothetical protein